MPSKLTRRTVLASAVAASGAKFLPKAMTSPAGKRILTVYYDKALGAMRAIDRVVR